MNMSNLDPYDGAYLVFHEKIVEALLESGIISPGDPPTVYIPDLFRRLPVIASQHIPTYTP